MYILFQHRVSAAVGNRASDAAIAHYLILSKNQRLRA